MELWKIQLEDVPRIYGISWSAENLSVDVSVSVGLFERLRQEKWSHPIIESLGKELGFDSFDDRYEATFGFAPGLTIDRVGEVVFFRAVVPTIKHRLNQPCKACDGTGKDRFLSGQCVHCFGDRHEVEYKWNVSYATSANLNLLLMRLGISEGEVIQDRDQLLTLVLHTGQGLYGGALGGIYSRRLVDWLAKRSGEIPEMVAAMKSSWEKMFGQEKYRERFRASVDYEGGWLNTDCPGNACGLNPSSHGVRKNEGYQFSCHNTDSPAQQLCLIAGLAALHDLVDRELYPAV
jgi:hypothetical protein